MSDARAIEIQISARVRKPKGKAIRGQLLREAIRYRLDYGQDPPGIRLRINGWTKGAHSQNADGFDQGDLWERFGPLLRARLLDPEPVRMRPRTAHPKSDLL
jgi:hypothetical protein